METIFNDGRETFEVKLDYGENEYRRKNKIITLQGLEVTGVEKIIIYVTNEIVLKFMSSEGKEIIRKVLSREQKLLKQNGNLGTTQYIFA